MVLLATTVLSVVLGITAPVTLASSVSVETWQPEIGDVFIVDTQTNQGYIVHRDGVFITFPVVTGKRAFVRYIGRTYKATTPEAAWVVKSRHTKGDRITFGVTGSFLRLYKNGDESTPYGIHGHRYSERMLSQEERFESMGCVIVSEEVLHILEDTYELNSQTLTVVTSYGLIPVNQDKM